MDMAFDIFSAFNQAGWIFGGLFMLLIGGAVLAADFYTRVHSTRYKARIKGIRVQGASLTAPPEPAPESPTPEKKEAFSSFARKNPGSAFLALLMALMIFGIPGVFIGFGVYQGEKHYELLMRGVETHGTVIRNEYDSGSKGGSYHSVFRYQDSGGAFHEWRDPVSVGNSPAYAPGANVVIYYDPAQPDRATVDDLSHIIAPFIFTGLGAAVIFFIFFFPNLKKSILEKGKKKYAPPPGYANEMYYAVYEYTTRQGETILAEGDCGSNFLESKEPGRQVHILVMSDRPRQGTAEGYALFLFGLFMIGMAAWLFSIAFIGFKTSIFTFIALGGFIIYGASRFATNIIPPEKRGSVKKWKEANNQKFIAKQESLPMISHDEWALRMRWHDALYRKWMPVYIMMALVPIALGAYVGRDMLEKTAHGIVAHGEIARLESDHYQDKTSYYAVAHFTDAQGRGVEFRDKVGSSAPFYRPGDAVKILYNPAQPNDAIIDRGYWNWLVPGVLGGFGLLILFAALRSYAGILYRSSRR